MHLAYRGVLRGALTSRPYQTSLVAAYSTHNPCYSADTSVIKGDDFDFWAFREQETKKREEVFEAERNVLRQQFKNAADTSFAKYLEIALNESTFRETVGKMSGENFDKFRPLHFQAVAAREAMRGEPQHVRTIHLMMLSSDVSTNEQDYVYLFRSLWKNGTPADLLNLLKEMKLFGLTPTAEMIKVAGDSCRAAGDAAGEKTCKTFSSVAPAKKKLSYKEELETEANQRFLKMDLTREILEREGPGGDFFPDMFNTHRTLN